MRNTPLVISVVVPAHNEATVIGRLLRELLREAVPDEFEVIVVANGCTDDTVAVASTFGEPVTVVATPVASKYHALRLGDEHARAFPRLYVDADVVLGTRAARILATALAEPGVRAVAPERVVDLTGRPWPIRWYYDVWQRLPQVRAGLFGRGVIGVDMAGQRRLVAAPQVMGDDLAASVAFEADERRVVDEARVVVQPPRTIADLIRRRVRSLTATAQLRLSQPAAVDGARTSRSDLLALMRRKPSLTPKVAVFLVLTVIARRRARRPIRSRDFSTWLRDESSRAT